ncbi:similar to Saccharomyces cerevisiae YHR062C RPP1 Subunit of both RNase MRP and nuclear RNase P [Maudiozyma barnettii]|uniref:Similar to Saccharomyces cerevisiae YHR062C RPP1 Subunit of both RNase MRP and nuclear RNase P n=1 Tax=Maudiozyma barnettii TaxID=61262 RepID=A0A8H2ZFH5_9SACH|nr:RNA-binding RNA processing protein RPP1 [Kazachstania barnettii]CAB4252364.1 similar to Saccharomyces cerevisiae YHR062C RPP1 Subunit of both RNase MRP and nuclear RNase P [Kazachstania barnettii]CAD1779098.1 similar to Saccharomyces cerevisiae YHR062C RPP1 Subunit of both RNase MRP and nuclear RNase P [Kazachstania barnettii]
MLVDLNVRWPQESFSKPASEKDISELRATLLTLHNVGYTHIALNFTVRHTDKFPSTPKEMNPMDIQNRFGELMKGTGLKIYSRLTLIIDDPSKGQSLNKISQVYDLIAALPVSEKGLTLATTSLDIDLLTFDYGNRFPTFLKHKNICGCVKRGVKVEIVYSYTLRDLAQRRQFVQNVRSVIRSSRSRGLVVSSGARNSLEVRNILGVSALLRTLGLPSDQCSKAMGDTAGLVLLNGRLRTKSYKQTIAIGNGDVVDDLNTLGDGIKIVKRSHSSNETETSTAKKPKI